MPVKGIGRQAIETYKDYLIELRARIAELIGNGVPPDQVAAELAGWKYHEWGRAELFPVCAEHVYKDVAWRMRFSLHNPAQIMTRAEKRPGQAKGAKQGARSRAIRETARRTPARIRAALRA
jgi:hypothetical protein